MDDDYTWALARLDACYGFIHANGCGALYPLLRALLVERQAEDDEPTEVDFAAHQKWLSELHETRETRVAALSEFVRGAK